MHIIVSQTCHALMLSFIFFSLYIVDGKYKLLMSQSQPFPVSPPRLTSPSLLPVSPPCISLPISSPCISLPISPPVSPQLSAHLSPSSCCLFTSSPLSSLPLLNSSLPVSLPLTFLSLSITISLLHLSSSLLFHPALHSWISL